MLTILRAWSSSRGISVRYGRTSGRTRRDAGEGHSEGGQFGGHPSTWRIACWPPRLLQVQSCVGSSDGTGHRGSGHRLCPVFCHFHSIMRAGKKHLKVSIESYLSDRYMCVCVRMNLPRLNCSFNTRLGVIRRLRLQQEYCFVFVSVHFFLHFILS